MKSTEKQKDIINPNTQKKTNQTANITGSFFNRLKIQPTQEDVLPKITQHITDEIVQMAEWVWC